MFIPRRHKRTEAIKCSSIITVKGIDIIEIINDAEVVSASQLVENMLILQINKWQNDLFSKNFPK